MLEPDTESANNKAGIENESDWVNETEFYFFIWITYDSSLLVLF